MDVIDKIMLLLDEKELAQKDLTDFLGVDKSTFTAWKQGNSKSYQKYLPEIADYFDVSIDWLLGNGSSKKMAFPAMKDLQRFYKCTMLLHIRLQKRRGYYKPHSLTGRMEEPRLKQISFLSSQSISEFRLITLFRLISLLVTAKLQADSARH